MTCRQLHTEPSLCPVCRYEPWFQAQTIRHAIKHKIGPASWEYQGIRFACYNREEAEAIRALLTPAELKIVSFTWWEWR